MGLKISTYKTNGNTYTDVYAKVNNINYNNSNKIVRFDVEVYDTKDSENLIERVQGIWAKVDSNTAIIAQCYNKLSETISQRNSNIALKEIDIEYETDIIIKARKEFELSRAKSDKILQLTGIEWQ